MAEHAFERAPVILKAAGDDGDITPAAVLIAHELQAERGGLFTLVGHAPGAV